MTTTTAKRQGRLKREPNWFDPHVYSEVLLAAFHRKGQFAEELVESWFQETGMTYSRNGNFRDRNGCFALGNAYDGPTGHPFKVYKYSKRPCTPTASNRWKNKECIDDRLDQATWDRFCNAVWPHLSAIIDREKKEAEQEERDKRAEKAAVMFRPGGIGAWLTMSSFARSCAAQDASKSSAVQSDASGGSGVASIASASTSLQECCPAKSSDPLILDNNERQPD